MKDDIARRLQQLKAERETGHRMLADLEGQQVRLRETMLRISGAIQVLEELLSQTFEVEETGDYRDGTLPVSDCRSS